MVGNQTSKVLSVKVAALTKEDGDLSMDDLDVPGTQLLLHENGKGYPVTLIANPKKRKHKIACNEELGKPPKKRALKLSDSEVCSCVFTLN